MAFVRWKEFAGGELKVKGPYRPGDRTDLIPELWLRDLGVGTEQRLPGWKPQGDDGYIHTDRRRLPLSWSDAATLLLDDGSLVDATTGVAATPRIAVPADALPASLAWSRDGKRAACIVQRSVPEGKFGTFESTIVLLEAGKEPKPLVLGNGATGQRVAWEQDGMNLDKGVLEWTTGSDRLRFCLSFHEYGSWHYWLRTGLLDLDGTARVLATSAHDGAWLRSTWSADGSRGAFLLERGGGDSTWHPVRADQPDAARLLRLGRPQSDIFATNANGSELARITDDAALKGALAIDPAGRRVAFVTGETDDRGRVPKAFLRILDLATGTAHDLPLPSPGDPPSSLLWMPRGDRLLYGSGGGVYLQSVEAGPAASADRSLRRIPFTWTALVVEALASENDLKTYWGMHLARQEWDPALVPALRQAVRTWVERTNGDWGVGSDLLELLYRRGVKEALPEVRMALTPECPFVSTAVQIAAEWMGKDALPELDVVRTKGDGNSRDSAAAAMANLGDERGWETLVASMNGPRPPLFLLAQVRQPRSVDLLLPFLDATTPNPDPPYDSSLTTSDAAEMALARLTGKAFGKDRAQWTVWWTEEAKRVLPEVPDPNPAVLEVRRAFEARRKAKAGGK
jgi:hypothetical protein